MPRDLTVGAFRVTIGAESPHEAWEEIHSENIYTDELSEAVRIQGEATFTPGDSFTFTDLFPGATGDVRFYYVKNHGTESLTFSIIAGGTDDLNIIVDVGSEFMLRGSAVNTAATAVVLKAATALTKYTLVLGINV